MIINKNLREKIIAVRKSKAKALGLSWEFLIEVPYEIFDFFYLEVLILNNNKISAIPQDIQKLYLLNHLDLSSNEFTEFPENLTTLQNLTSLSLRNNKIDFIPPSIGKLKKLETLDLSNNNLQKLPKEISQLQNLRKLRLTANLFQRIPESIFALKSLEILEFFEDDLDKDEFDNKRKFKLYNPIVEIPNEFLYLQNLQKFSTNPISLETPPVEIVSRGVGTIKDYLRQMIFEGKDYLFEAKLLIVGEGGAGKTTLAKKIEDPSYKLSHKESTTRGIEVLKWEFNIPPISLLDLDIDIRQEKKFRVNVWDFGGQEIYHSTHQFFLTKRSLYALVADTRKEDTDFYYWLNIVELLSDNSPIIIIKNEIEERVREINERQLKAHFTNLKEVISTNLATNRGFGDILKNIVHLIPSLPHVGTSLPKTWVNVRKELETNSKNYIALNEYFDICERNGFYQRKDALQLSSYLHDLGVFLHFQDDPLLRNTVILKPEWGTKAVYKVLDNEKIIRKLGLFTGEELRTIWKDEIFEGIHDELLQLMMKFQLCYRLPEESPDTYIAPQLLTENQPKYDWPETGNLLLKYSYIFMPKGILTRFIVVMHQYILDQDNVWKSGVLLRKDDTDAEIIENYVKREISIRIHGKLEREFMAIITYELDRIHDTYNRLKYDKLIPCNCEICSKQKIPHFYPLEILYKFIADKQPKIQCPVSYQMVEVFKLIDNVMMINIKSTEDKADNIRISLLSTKINAHFNDAEIRSLCLDLEVNYDDLIGDTHLNRIQSLIGYLNRRGRAQNLFQSLRTIRPNVNWP